MTEEEKAAEIERLRRLQERNRLDSLMAKQRTQSYRMARARVQQEKQQRKLQQRQQLDSQSQGGLSGAGGGMGSVALMRQESLGTRPVVSRSLTLEPLHDEYSRLLMNTMSQAGTSASVRSVTLLMMQLVRHALVLNKGCPSVYAVITLPCICTA
jgi:hypothetical protein